MIKATKKTAHYNLFHELSVGIEPRLLLIDADT